MAFLIDEVTTKVQFSTFRRMPNLIYQACVKTETLSNTIYIQHAVCEALARDLGLDLDELIAELPVARSKAKHLWHGGPGTNEEVR